MKSSYRSIQKYSINATCAASSSQRAHFDCNITEEQFYEQFLNPHIPRPIWCDTIASFPNAFAHCLNSGNNSGLADLLGNRLHHHCDLKIMCTNSDLNRHSFLKFFEVTSELFPDRIMFVSTTQTGDNQVTASVLMKFTTNKRLYEAVARTVTDPSLFFALPTTRTQYFQRKFCSKPEAEKRQLAQLVESDADLVVYGQVQVVLTLDATTLKGTSLHVLGGITTAHLSEDRY